MFMGTAVKCSIAAYKQLSLLYRTPVADQMGPSDHSTSSHKRTLSSCEAILTSLPLPLKPIRKLRYNEKALTLSTKSGNLPNSPKIETPVY
jgi:hypothetical protein